MYHYACPKCGKKDRFYTLENATPGPDCIGCLFLMFGGSSRFIAVAATISSTLFLITGIIIYVAAQRNFNHQFRTQYQTTPEPYQPPETQSDQAQIDETPQYEYATEE